MTASSNRTALAGVAIAIIITTTLDAKGYFMFSALPLIPLTGVLWYLQKMSRAEIGFTAGKLGDYGPAILYPLLALGVILVPYVAFNLRTSGSILPNTFYAKQTEYQVDWPLPFRLSW